MLPKAALPQTSLAPLDAACRNSLAFFDVAGEISLNEIPARGKIDIADR